jgi:formylglycine-generating enzyme required for sulfatase activity
MATWFDAVVWLNALTEWVNAKEGKSLEPVYYYDSGYTTLAKDSDYSSNFVKEDNSYVYASAYAKTGTTGFRLPSSNEWELAARWRGSNMVNVVNNATFNTAPWYTKGNSASGATADYNNATASAAVAWYSTNSSSKTQAVKGRTVNALGLYDMSGNVWERCFDWRPEYIGSFRILRGGGWYNGADGMQVGNVYGSGSGGRHGDVGFRPARTAQ